ncbi:MAG: response regulator transcription factor [Gammaproteobacteria bacterium]|nr:response regulator transcription factor [Gammaproteobacteria bacterium]
MTHKILIVEDNADIARLIQLNVKDINCKADIADDGIQALDMFAMNHYELVILDLMLPGIDGLEVCRQLRSKAAYVPILMLTSKSSELDRVVGLELGADDYITKPFSILELLARIKSQFRRIEAVKPAAIEEASCIQAGDLYIDINRRQVLNDGKEVALTAKEFDLLVHFSKNPGRVYSRMQLLEQVWGYQYEGYEHTVNSHINRLRTKIEADLNNPRYIQTVWGVGYRFGEIEQ